MVVKNIARRVLLIVQGFVAVTAIAGGTALVLASISPSLATSMSPPLTYLDGSPFASYLAPGLALAGLLGGIHIAAFVMAVRRDRWGLLISAAAAFAVLIWIFVQMVFIPFSFLQAIYFTAGLGEVGLVMVLLDLFEAPAPSAPSSITGAAAPPPQTRRAPAAERGEREAAG